MHKVSFPFFLQLFPPSTISITASLEKHGYQSKPDLDLSPTEMHKSSNALHELCCSLVHNAIPCSLALNPKHNYEKRYTHTQNIIELFVKEIFQFRSERSTIQIKKWWMNHQSLFKHGTPVKGIIVPTL